MSRTSKAVLLDLCVVASSVWYVRVDNLMAGIFSSFGFVGLAISKVIESVGYCVGRAAVPFHRGFERGFIIDGEIDVGNC